MTDAEIKDRLETADTGVLALADDGDAYAIPLNHHYDGDAVYFRLGQTPNSTKQSFLDATETASYVVYDAAPTDDPRGLESWSILVSGHLTEVPPADRDRFDTAEINRKFAPIRVFDEAIEDVQIVVVKLEIETLTGRTTPDQ